jgi:phospholipid/cholesterol/gamma-HCH transport system substrate-binding protein
MIQRITKVKLFVFVGITIVALTITALSYVRLPQQVGIGRYGVTVNLDAAGGLYPQSTVAYRGVEVGKVTGVDLGPGGTAVAHLQIDNGVEIPSNSIAEVRSSSVIGEQYVNFVPPPDGGTTNESLEDGATISADQTRLPTTTDRLLTSVDNLLTSIPRADLRTVVKETGAATRGVGPELGNLIGDSHDFLTVATQNLEPTIALLDDAGPVLKTLQALDPNIRAFSRNLNSLTGALNGADSQLRGVLEAGGPFMREIGAFADELRPQVPAMLAELADTGQVLNLYKGSLEHLLILLPALVPSFSASIPTSQQGPTRNEANMWFKLGFEPPTCTVGFADGGHMRDPSDLRVLDPSPNDWCKVAPNDARAARGARNSVCPNGGRAATAAACGLVFDQSVVNLYRQSTATNTPRTITTATTGSAKSLDSAAATFLLLGGDSLPTPETLRDLLTGLVN